MDVLLSHSEHSFPIAPSDVQNVPSAYPLHTPAPKNVGLAPLAQLLQDLPPYISIPSVLVPHVVPLEYSVDGEPVFGGALIGVGVNV